MNQRVFFLLVTVAFGVSSWHFALQNLIIIEEIVAFYASIKELMLNWCM